MAKISKAFDSLIEKIWVIVTIEATNTVKISNENASIAEVMMKNHNETPAVTANALNRGDDNSILDWIDKSYKT
jgi:type IV secretory pathway ATPase VirB11/archaellum biosynthesis ATPase